MTPLRAFWLSLILSVTCVVTFALSYFTLAEGKRNQSAGLSGVIALFGSPLFVAVISIAVFRATLYAEEGRQRKTWIAVAGGAALATTYFYFLMFVVLNTLGS